MVSLFLAAACTEDNSSTGGSMSSITITEMDEPISVASYTGINLKNLVKPEVQTSYPEDKLTYAWYLFNNVGSEGGYKKYKISDQREPDYEVNLPTGTYTLAFEVTAPDGYSKLASITLTTSTSFSKGFYILKETADGNTELDMLNDTEPLHNLMESLTGSALSGKPLNLSVIYNAEYINPDKNETDVANLLHVTTQGHVYKGFRTEDLKEVFNNDNLFYSGTMEATEQPCTFVQSFYRNFYLSNTGIRSTTLNAEQGKPSTGKLGYPINNGASRYAQSISMMGGHAFWNATTHQLEMFDYNGSHAIPIEYKNAAGNVVPNAYPSDMECIASGCNDVTAQMWFLLEQPSTAQRYLLLLASTAKIDKIIKLDAALHLSKSSSVSGNGRTAAYIYCIDSGKAYAYSLLNGKEIEVPLPGIPQGETPTFITNQFLALSLFISSKYNFDDLIVGTQRGGEYKLYFYEKAQLNGGIPIAAPAKTASGEGQVKAVRFVSPQNDIGGMNFAMINHPFPISD